MTNSAISEKLEAFGQALFQLQKRVEDLEDLLDLETAIEENAGKPLIPWEQVKAEFDLEFPRECK